MTTDAPKLLLTTIFKPYGIRDGYAESLGMQMELFNNQITREQEVHSPRANYWTFPLYFLAENISVPAVVLDLPSWRDFVRELENGYTHVGISFIQTNVMKARRMAQYIRRHHPDTTIILGGYGTLIPDIADLVPHDELCRGEGVSWIRKYFGQENASPVRHPIMNGVAQRHIYGLPVRSKNSAVVFPGLGCPNRCFFCSTSAMYGGQYVPILPDGKSVFAVCRAAEKQLGVEGFAIIDENFLKCPDRARELLAEMEAAGKAYNFAIFSSVEAIRELGVDFLVRLGASVVWIGIESERRIFDKLSGVDARGLIERLQANGISVISSSILFLDHHDPQTIGEAIDWAIGMKGDFHQFMQLTPLAGTPLFEDYRRRGLLLPDFSYTQVSGHDVLNFHHPHFAPGAAPRITRDAFRRYYRARGPGLVNMARTFVRGYRTARREAAQRARAGLAWDPDRLRYVHTGGRAEDRFMNLRLEVMKRTALDCRPLMLAARLYAPNPAVRRVAVETARLYTNTFGRPGLKMRLAQAALAVSGAIEKVRIEVNRGFKRHELIRTPPTRRIAYRLNGA